MSKIMIALGGNALGKNPKEQLELVSQTAQPIVDLIEEGHTVVVSHGNGPQVGMINLSFQSANLVDNKVPEMPFPECGAMSEGYIGYHLQSAIKNELSKRGINKSVGTILTQVVVDQEDEAFLKPSKPIGNFYTEKEANNLEIQKGYSMIEDSGRGYRRVVPSPKPVDIVEIEIIRDMVNSGHIVIAAGGGGIPTLVKDNILKGVDAVIDKDHASEKLAEMLDFDILFILTEVETISLDFGKKSQRELSTMTIQESEKFIKEGHFASGSMLPKVIAATNFVKSKPGRQAIVASLKKAKQAFHGETGTRIL